METSIIWIVKSTIVSGILYIYYLIFLRNKKFHSYNRFYLLSAFVISLVTPFIHFSWHNVYQAPDMPINIFWESIRFSTIKQQPSFHFGMLALMLIGCGLVSIILFTSLFTGIIWIYRIKRTHNSVRMQGFNLIETSIKQAPFSFLDNLFWKQGLSMNDDNGKTIFIHELNHIRQRHTYDKLFTRIVICIYWMNPFYWLIQKELNIIHEFIADAASISEGDTASFALMLLQSHNDGRYINLTHSFLQSPIKRRLTMINALNNTKHPYLWRMLSLPVGLLTVALFSVTAGQAQEIDPKANPGPVKISSVSLEKKPGRNNGDDSTVNVRIGYFKADGSPSVLQLTNVKYKPGIRNPSEDMRSPHLSGQCEV